MALINLNGKKVSPVIKESAISKVSESIGGRNNELKKLATKLISSGLDEFEVGKKLYIYDLRNHGVPLFSDPEGEYPNFDRPIENAIRFASNIRRTLGIPSKLEEVKRISPFKIISIGDILNSNENVNWLVDGLLIEGGLSVMAGKPKSGKSTLSRQLGISVARGTPFLDRETTKKKVLYLALEEQVQMIKRQMRAQGAEESDPILFHVGGVDQSRSLEALEAVIIEEEVSLVIVDTLYLLVSVNDGNDYQKVNKVMSGLRHIARSTNCHILCLHHQNKGESRGTNSIHGSSALHGAVDTAIIFNQEGGNRFISSSQRGGTPYEQNELIFDKDSESYEIGTDRMTKRLDKLKKELLFSLQSMSKGLSKAELLSSVKGSSDSKKQALKELIDGAQIRREGRGVTGDPFIYTLTSDSPIYTGVKGLEDF